MKTKSKKKKASKGTPEVASTPSNRKSVEIQKGVNGYVVSQYHEGKNSTYIAKDSAEAKKIAADLLSL